VAICKSASCGLYRLNGCRATERAPNFMTVETEQVTPA
jgi:hypothetical protein